ncbi:hypothetical protein [Shinella zoogloeoides]|uniref:hypothetical protein n=1 Tax=Shinella zoogloeoides TaxID=352475 RepID=UPI001F59FB4D|nr:hypothetical protein [Shinella zoogloeoides]
MSGKERMRRYRRRTSSGRRCILIEIDEVSLPETLVAGGYLDAAQTDDMDAIRRGIERMHSDLAAMHMRDA